MLFHVYGGNGIYQWIAMLAVLAGLILLNEFARRTKFGGLMMFGIIPLALTVYFIVIAVCAGQGVEWAVNNQTHLYMNGWFHYAKLYAALAGCIGFRIKDVVIAVFNGFINQSLFSGKVIEVVVSPSAYRETSLLERIFILVICGAVINSASNG